MQPKIGEIITVENVKYITELAVNQYENEQCKQCHLLNKPCMHIDCTAFVRKDGQAVIFKEIKEMEVKIQIPDNCELIKDGDIYVVKEKKNDKPRSWEEFCKNYPIQKGESIIDINSKIASFKGEVFRSPDSDRYICTSKEEAEAFLALMQLRQLRKAWVGDWEQPKSGTCIAAIAYNVNDKRVAVETGNYWSNMTLSFPTKEMAEDFLSCFRDLCEKAKILL